MPMIARYLERTDPMGRPLYEKILEAARRGYFDIRPEKKPRDVNATITTRLEPSYALPE